MTFPQILGTSSGYHGDEVPLHFLPLPTGTVTGDKLLLIVAEQLMPGILVFQEYITSSGDEINGSLGYSPSLAGPVAYVVYRATGYSLLDVSSLVSGSNSTPDAPNLSAPSGDNLWISAAGWLGDISHAAFSAAYTGHQETARYSDLVNGVGIATSARALTASSENPGTQSLNAAASWGALTIVLIPDCPCGSGTAGCTLGCNGDGLAVRCGSGTAGCTIGCTGTGGTIFCGSGTASTTIGCNGDGLSLRCGSGTAPITLGCEGGGGTVGGGSGDAPVTLGCTGIGFADRCGSGIGAMILGCDGIGAMNANGSGLATATFSALGHGDSLQAAEGGGPAAISLSALGYGQAVRYGSGIAQSTFSAIGAGNTTRSGSGSASVSFSSLGHGQAINAAQGSGIAPITLGALGQGFTDRSGSAIAALSLSALGDGTAIAGASGVAALSLSCEGDGFSDRCGSGIGEITLSAIGAGAVGFGGDGVAELNVSALGTGYFTACADGLAALQLSATGAGTTVRSGSGLAAMFASQPARGVSPKMQFKKNSPGCNCCNNGCCDGLFNLSVVGVVGAGQRVYTNNLPASSTYNIVTVKWVEVERLNEIFAFDPNEFCELDDVVIPLATIEITCDQVFPNFSLLNASGRAVGVVTVEIVSGVPILKFSWTNYGSSTFDHNIPNSTMNNTLPQGNSWLTWSPFEPCLPFNASVTKQNVGGDANSSVVPYFVVDFHYWPDNPI